jgi:hypothetical protein
MVIALAPRRSPMGSLILAIIIFSLASCGGGGGFPPPPNNPDGPDASIDVTDNNDVGNEPEEPQFPNDANGPTISLVSPASGSVVLEGLATIVVTITDADIVDDTTVKLYLDGQLDAPIQMNTTAVADTYQAFVNVSNRDGTVGYRVVAHDLKGDGSTLVEDFIHPQGPKIFIDSPQANQRKKDSVAVQIRVVTTSDDVTLIADIAGYAIPFTATASGANETTYTGTVVFDAPVFPRALTGDQVLTVTAIDNNSGAQSVAERDFIIDDQGPTVSIETLSPGSLVGGIIELGVTATDPAGINPFSVVCVLGNYSEEGGLKK